MRSLLICAVMVSAAFIVSDAQEPVTTSGQGNPVISGVPNQANGPLALDASGNGSLPGKITIRTAVLPAWVDPRAYGAKCDGTINDAAALQNAITAPQYALQIYIERLN